MIIDAHTHIGAMGKDDSVVTVADLLQSMDEAGIDISLIIANDVIVPDEWRGVPADDILAQCAGNKRLKVIGNISIGRDIPAQLRHLQEYIEASIVVGVKLYPGYENFYPTDKRLQPVYEFCQAFHVPVVLHTGLLMVGSSGVEQQTHSAGIDKIATQFSQLTIVMAHCGNPWITEAARVVSHHHNVYADLSAFFSEYEPISVQEKTDFQQKMKEFVRITGNLRKCLFGTDRQLYSQQEYLEAVRELPMDEEECELVFWKNATTVFRLGSQLTLDNTG